MTLTPPPVTGIALQASTGQAGVALQNGTPTFLTWNVPNDGQLHRFYVVSSLDVTVAETGGNVQVSFTLPDGSAGTFAQHGPNLAVSTNRSGPLGATVQPGSTVTIRQSTALTAGTAQMWADLWGE